MAVISVSLTEDNIQALDEIQKAFGLAGRSEAVCLTATCKRVQ